ncbi:MAG TPA: hypothetical protein IAD11_05590 [Candidatus Stercorousia faecigallinarum]|nr:hypothetical protein [Candidatus Stercorousia faecigallinarum]
MIDFIQKPKISHQQSTNKLTSGLAEKTPIVNITAQKSDSVELSNHEKTKKVVKYTALITGITLAIVAIVKRKSIGKFFSNLFERNNSAQGKYPDGKSPAGGKLTDVGGRTNSSGGSPPPPAGGGKLAPEVQEIQTATRESYMEKYAQLKAKGQKLKGEEWRQNESKMIHLVDEAASKNISLVPKREFKPGASEEERFKYFKKDVFPVMDACEASVLDGLEMFEKYGFKKLYDDCGQQKTLLDDLVQGTAIRDPLVFTNYKMTDKIADKYLDVFDKYAEKTFNDLGALEFFFNCCNKVMSEETALKFIATLKKFIYSQDSAVPPKVAFVDPYLGRFRDNPKIVAAMKDLMEYIKDLPKN